jgi:hypothetical protein
MFPKNEAAGLHVGLAAFALRSAPLETPSTSHVYRDTRIPLVDSSVGTELHNVGLCLLSSPFVHAKWFANVTLRKKQDEEMCTRLLTNKDKEASVETISTAIHRPARQGPEFKARLA